ncbi:MAG: transposase, partial [Planctomycetes bacterium]|nr:transposase [Planctomycetota bacterium]
MLCKSRIIPPNGATAPISNQRLAALQDGEVSFTVKNRDTRQRELRTLPAVEFLSRFITHILPPGLHRIRFCGL